MVILLTMSVGVIVILAALGAVIIRLVNPQADIQRGVEALTGILQTVVGALVGFIGGRAQGRMEKNGH